jgi:hypothetical protein
VHKLIRQLQEEDLFPNATPDEIKDREANRPPRILEGVELVDTLRDVLCSILVDRTDKSDLSDYFMNGSPLLIDYDPTVEPIGEMKLETVVEMLKKTTVVAGTTLEQALLSLVFLYTGQKFDKIRGL